MSMQLTVDHLMQLKGDLEKITAADVQVSEFICGEHRVFLRWTNGVPVVVGLTLVESHKPITLPGSPAGSMRRSGRQ